MYIGLDIPRFPLSFHCYGIIIDVCLPACICMYIIMYVYMYVCSLHVCTKRSIFIVKKGSVVKLRDKYRLVYRMHIHGSDNIVRRTVHPSSGDATLLNLAAIRLITAAHSPPRRANTAEVLYGMCSTTPVIIHPSSGTATNPTT